MTQFKVGDKVQLKEKFYNEEVFKLKDRKTRKLYSSRKDNVYTVSGFAIGDRMLKFLEEKWLCFEVSLFELAEKPVIESKQKTGMYAKVTVEVGGAPKGTVIEITPYGESTNGVRGFTHRYKENTCYGTIGCNAELVPDSATVPVMRKWTDAEVMEAKGIVAECMYVFLADSPYLTVADIKDGEDTHCCLRGKTSTAHCCKTDEWNRWIGRMVSMSKATGRDLPVWIRRGT